MKIRREVKIGIFALAMLVCLYLGINYLKGKDVFSGDRPYYALVDHTNGLQTSAPVMVRGVKVGAVTGIELDTKNPDKVVVNIGVKKNMKIPVDSYLKVVSNGIMGGKSVELVMGVTNVYFVRNDLIPSEIESGLLESASLSMEDLVADAKKMMASLTTSSNSLNEILVQNTDALRGTMSNFESVSRQLSDAKIGAMIADLGAFSAMLRDNSGKFEGIIDNLDEVTGAIAEADLRATLDTLGMGISHLNTALAKLSDVEEGGTASRLLNDPALYDSLTVAVGDLSALLEDLKANPKRYVHFSLFGRKNK